MSELGIEGYQLLTRLAACEHGEVWRAQPAGPCDEANRRLIIKVGTDKHGRQRVRREVEALSLLAGAQDEAVRNALPVLVDAAVEAQQPYLVLREPQGSSLLSRIERRGRLDETAVTTMLGDVLLALSHAHRRGVIHGAITPASIFVDVGFGAVLIDFGFGPIDGQSTQIETGLATRELLIGRMQLGAAGIARSDLVADEFVAPEAVRAGLLHPGTDLYALGRVAAFALLGVPSRQSTDVMLAREPLSTSMRRIVLTLADEIPQDRYESAEAALKVVQAISVNRVINPAFAALGAGSLHNDTEAGAKLQRRQQQRLTKERPTKGRNRRTLAVFLGLVALMVIPLLAGEFLFGKADDDIDNADDEPAAPVQREDQE